MCTVDRYQSIIQFTQQQRNKKDLLQIGIQWPERQRTDGLSRWRSLCRKSALHFTMTLTFDIRPWKPLQKCRLRWWIFVPRFIQIRPLSTEIASRGIGVNRRRTARRTDVQWPDGIPATAHSSIAETKKGHCLHFLLFYSCINLE